MRTSQTPRDRFAELMADRVAREPDPPRTITPRNAIIIVLSSRSSILLVVVGILTFIGGILIVIESALGILLRGEIQFCSGMGQIPGSRSSHRGPGRPCTMQGTLWHSRCCLIARVRNKEKRYMSHPLWHPTRDGHAAPPLPMISFTPILSNRRV
jgi:hypothetical protein